MAANKNAWIKACFLVSLSLVLLSFVLYLAHVPHERQILIMLKIVKIFNSMLTFEMDLYSEK